MEKKRKILQYRERLDRTLASPDLTNDEKLKKLVKSQLLHSSEVAGYEEKVVETKTAEVSSFLDMLRSASDDCGRSNTSHTDWKLKQDSEEFRVMYREVPKGSPFHTLLLEGFVDAPVDVCLCISWQTSLYKKWWPQSTIPTFKILTSECLDKDQIAEQISLVRMKVPWPAAVREAVVHYNLFECFQDDLIVVLTNSMPESNSGIGNLWGSKNEAIPEAKDVVRVDLVGGFALQKVTSERSYFRTIANMDMKLGIVPPSLINFISRQLIGNGFKLYKKTVASMMSHEEEEFSKALEDPLYARIREALYSTRGSKAMNGGELQQVARVLPAEDLVVSEQGGAEDVSKEDKNIQYASSVTSTATDATLLNSKAFCEIVEVGREEIVQGEKEDDEKVNVIPNKEVDVRAQKGNRSVHIRAEVEEALETLDKAISMVREYRIRSLLAYEDSVEVPNRDMLEGTSQEAPQGDSGIQNLRYTGSNPYSKEVNSNKVVPTSSEQNLSRPIESSQVASYSLENGAIEDQTTCNNKLVDADFEPCVLSDDKDKSTCQTKENTIVTKDVPNKLSRHKKYLYCCFLF
ncbi:uncharacterized protein LOC130717048 isoform X2 [Lotus japonicus]|uniref:uncharacterized protein LOC130717048 isoform X2 n=1 Tax=Lotus japonicus TaxID=34305 RepID=UPI0025869F3D|nr:uncharacterized protein LOC130717048 isoform X2 [Lotus japonicus]